MGARMLRVFLVLLLSVWMNGSLSEIEVALAPDGSIITENRPLEKAATDSEVNFAMKNDNNVASIAKDTVDTPGKSNFAILTMLQKELEVVEEMVKLQDKKLAVLQEMREIWLQEQKMKIQENGDVTKRRSAVDIGEILERRLDAAISETVAGLNNFDSYFVERSSIKLDSEVADMKMMKIRVGSATELVAVAYRDGVIVLYTSSTEELLRINTKRKGIKSIAIESLDDEPYLIVIYETSTVAIYELKLVEKSKGEDVDDREKAKKFIVSSGFDHHLSVNDHRTIELSAKPVVVTIVKSSRQLVAAVALNDGMIDFIAFNGTILRQIQTHASISAIETKRNLLAFNNGTDVILSSMTRVQGTVFFTCPGSSAQVSSIAFDPVHPEILYTGTHRGEVLVYAVNSRAPSGTPECRLLSRSTVTKYPHDGSPIVLAATKMYVIASGFQDITVFNVSKAQRNDISLSRMCTKSLNRSIISSEQGYMQFKAFLPVLAFSEGTMGSHLAFLTPGVSGQTNLLIFHSLLPDDKEPSDFQWTVLIYGGIIVVAIIGSQLFIMWQRRTNVTPWDSIGKKHNSLYEKYGSFKDREHSSEFDEDFGRYNSVRDELRRNFSQTEKESTHRSMNDDTDY